MQRLDLAPLIRETSNAVNPDCRSHSAVSWLGSTGLQTTSGNANL